MQKKWTSEELDASVEAYATLLRQKPNSPAAPKREVYRKLSARFGRTEKAFEYRMQNISAVLDEAGQLWIKGLKPASNVGVNVKEYITASLLKRGIIPLEMSSTKTNYKQKLPAVRAWLINVARRETTVHYADVMTAFGIDRFTLRHGMDRLGHEAKERNEPIITALIVNKKTGRCSDGLAKEFGIYDDEMERKKLYNYWAKAKSDDVVSGTEASSLATRAAMFASVEIRPDQAAFRRRVFLAYSGRCAISGCNIQRTLDAAHKHGRDWRAGNNNAEDGYLLRKDLHALYDARLLDIDDNGVVTVAPSALEHYKQFMTARISVKAAWTLH